MKNCKVQCENGRWFAACEDNEVNFKECQNGDSWEFLKKEPGGGKTDFLIIHRGILEKMLRDDNKTENEDEVNKMLAAMRTWVKHIIVDSGRGKAQYLDRIIDDIRFINLENLYKAFFDCKVVLVQTLLRLVNRKITKD